MLMGTSAKIIQQVIRDLQSDDNNTVLTAIATARQKGDKQVVAPLVKLLAHKNEDIRTTVKNALFDLKDKESVDAILDHVEKSDNREIRNILLQSLWQSNIQPVNAVSRLVKIALKGSLEDTIEVYSVITNIIDEVIPDSEIMESILLIQNGLEHIKDKPQKQLINDISSFLQTHQEEMM